MKAILFDFGGTLDSDGTAWKDRFYPLYPAQRLSVPREKFDRAFYDADDNLPLRHKLAGLGLEATVNLQVEDTLRNLGADLSLCAEIAGRFLSDSRAFFKRNAPVLESLKKNFRLGVVSNFYGNLDSVLASEGLAGYFGAVCDSAVVGFQKPSPEIFLKALEILGARPEEAVMVGDSVHRDMAGAKNSGIAGVLLWGERFAVSPPTAEFPAIKTLEELPEKLGVLA